MYNYLVKMFTHEVILVCFLGLFVTPAIDAAVTLKVNGLKAQIKNEHVELNFNADATLSTLLVNGKNIAASRVSTFYLDWNAGGHGVFKPSSIHIVEQSSNRVHFYWVQDKVDHAFNIELHYIMVSGLSGIYSYAKYRNDKSYTVDVGETRTVYRFDSRILNQATNQQRSGRIPTDQELKNAKTVQDSTWQFSNGTYYSKYDYAAYIRETNYEGFYGNGYGAFVVSPSREYHGGGPLKQDLTVHQECLIANYFLSGHLVGTSTFHAPPGWKHVYGPFLLFFPTGDNGRIISQVQSQAKVEQGNWPYGFVNDADYPKNRGSVSGSVSGQKHAMVVLWDSTKEAFDLQQGGYLYNGETDSSGHYNIEKVRPGTYKVAAYPLSGHGSENVAHAQVTVTAGGRQHVDLSLPEPKNIMWSLGQANRRSNEFKYADQPRNYKWQTMPPKETTFTIGKSKDNTDWYYAQSRPGNWYIKYQDTHDGKSRTLRIALAAASQKTHFMVDVNGHRVGNEYFANDQAIYRSAMQSGWYHSLVYTIQPGQVVNGVNTIHLAVSIGQLMYDTISLQKN